ncbi:MAG: hypothetical protein MHMPM18_004040 [Marteilia pararefringens]
MGSSPSSQQQQQPNSQAPAAAEANCSPQPLIAIKEFGKSYNMLSETCFALCASTFFDSRLNEVEVI